MDLFADENVDARIIRWLRDAGHDVVWAAEAERGAEDESLLRSSRLRGRVFLTFDLDFGELVFREGHGARGVILLRLRARSEAELLDRVRSCWPAVEGKAEGHFIVVSNDRVRVRPM